MAIRRMQVSNFRCLRSAEIEFDADFTLLSGPNAAGKTSVLESLYMLGRGRSFRSRHIDHLIRTGEERFIVFGEVDQGPRRLGLGVEGSALGLRAKIGGERASSLAELAVALPVQIIDPEVHRLIEEGPGRRRRFLDWGVFHVEHAFLNHWQQYQQVLRQRNRALKSRQPRAVVSAWDFDLIRLGGLVNDARSRYVTQLVGGGATLVQNLLGMQLSFSYRPGWSRELTFEEALNASRPQEQDTALTQIGPHRAELGIRLDGKQVKDRISRGQQKLLAAALLIAQLELLPRDSSIRPTLLLDDPAAELDRERLMRLIGELGRQAVQLVVTSLTPDFDCLGQPGRRYVVNAGNIIEQ